MAARWGTGEEILQTCNMESFTTASLDEAKLHCGARLNLLPLYQQAEILQDGLCNLQHHGLDTRDTLEALQSCLDPSILSIFEHSPTGEIKLGVDEESEATLLTALTDILDNVDDENLSPFDTLPDAELFQGQRGQEHSSLRKFLSLSRSPPEKESLLNSRRFSGKTMPSTPTGSMQICNGEEDDGISSFFVQDLDESSVDELDLCLPISLEKDGESMSVSLGDLVRHIHPYSMTVCMEGEEQLLPEGGIVLEVVDKGENGEPILAIPDLSLPLSLCNGDPTEVEQRVPENSLDKTELEPEVTVTKEAPLFEVSLVENVVVKQSGKESKKCSSKRRKKGKSKEAPIVEGRVLRSASSKKTMEECIKEPLEEQKKKKKVTFASVLTVAHPEMSKALNSSEMKTTLSQVTKESPSTALITTTITPPAPSREVCSEVLELNTVPVPAVNPISVDLPLDKCEADVSSKEEPSVSEPSEPKPKSISLQQYRLLRQQKKPLLPEKTLDNCTKWPSLPEAPKELLPIPCLPDPNPKDPRRSAASPVKKDPVNEVMPAWQPRGPAAPPTPEALLVPPASMFASSRKPEPPKMASPPPSKPANHTATFPSHSTEPNHQKLHITTSVPQNTIPDKDSLAAKQTPLEITSSLPLTSTNGATQHVHAPGQAKCLQDTPSTSDQVIKVIPSTIPTKGQDISKPQTRTEIITKTTTNVQTSNVLSVKLKAAVPLKSVTEQAVKALLPEPGKPALPVNTVRPAVGSQRHVAPIAAQPFTSPPIQARIVKLAEQMRMASAPVPKSKSPTAELIESFTSEIGIEAADLTSLLEQFEETQPKEEQSEPEVCGRAATVGNSSMEMKAETNALKKASSPDLGSTAGLTPPATPPHQIWKPLAPVALLGKPKKSEVPKQTPTKAIQIEPRPLTTGKLPVRPQPSVALGPTQPFSLDHDYCLIPKELSQNELGNRWNIKQQPSIIIKSVERPFNKNTSQKSESKLLTPAALGNLQKNLTASQPSLRENQSKIEHLTSTVMVTPDASPDRIDSESSLQDAASNRCQRYSERSPSPYRHKRGRSRRTYRTRSCSSSGSRSSSSESSRSRSPPSKRYRSGPSRSSSRSPSRYRSRSRSCSRSVSPPRRRRYSYSSSCSGSWSCSRSRSRSRSYSRSPSRSPTRRPRNWNTRYSPNPRSSYDYCSKENNEETRRQKEKAIEERRVVYVGRIHGGMTRKELRERFMYFGEVEDCTVHFRERGDNYGFVTYYNTKDAFNAIENGSKIRKPNELPFDLCFGGRRQFCKTGYADLDSNQDFDPAPAKRKLDALDFDTLLKQAQKNLKR